MTRRATPASVFFDRRRFLEALGLGVAAAVGSSCTRDARSSEGMLSPPIDRSEVFPAKRNFSYKLPAAVSRRELTPREKAASHGNFAEFLPGRGGAVWKYTDSFEAAPWKLEVAGECERPRILDLDDLFAIDHEERLYHFRCVEGWAADTEIWLSPISIWECLMLEREGRIRLEPNPFRWVRDVLATHPFREAPLNHEVALQTRGIALEHGDPADRFLAATAAVYNLTLVTGDEKLLGGSGYSVVPND